MARHAAEYIPAAGHDLFLPLYDPTLRLLMREGAFRRRFLAQADIRPGHRVLDVGCGTGTMAVLIRQSVPEATVVGVDGDPKALAIARRKAATAGVAIHFDEARADHLPYADASFERVLSSLVLHHLTHEDKLAAVREIRRVLVPGGSFHLADFGAPVGAYAKLVVHLFSHGERLGENLQGRLGDVLRAGGLAEVQERGHHNTLFGTIALWSASA
jgi:ubiquinone/menaquinone biosynthesis C-methylase UbiE